MAELENGVLLFGTQADSDEQALDAAHELLAETGQIVMDLEVVPMVPAAGR